MAGSLNPIAALMLAAALLCACASLASAASAATLKTPNNTTTSRVSSGPSARTFLLLAGGFGGHGAPLPYSEAYTAQLAHDMLRTDAGVPLFSLAAPMPTARGCAAAVAVPSASVILVMGGRDSDGSAANTLATVEAYKPLSNTWEQRAPLPVPLDGPAAAAYDSNSGAVVFVFGGRVYCTSDPINKTFAYDVANDAWSQTADMPYPVREATTAVAGNLAYVVGGATKFGDPSRPHQSFLRSVAVFDMATHKWTQLPDMPTARAIPLVAITSGALVVAGGTNASKAATSSWSADVVVEAFSFFRQSWITLQPLSTPRMGALCLTMPVQSSLGGATLALGGHSNRWGDVVDSTFVWDGIEWFDIDHTLPFHSTYAAGAVITVSE